MQINEALCAYLQQLAADGRSDHTRKQAKRHVRLFAAWIGDVVVEAVRHEDVARFLSSETVTRTARGSPRKPTSANALRSSLRCFFGFVHAAGYTPVNAGRMIRRARCGAPRPKAVSGADQQKLLAALETAKTFAERRDRVLFSVLLRVGLRVGSAVGLDVEDVDLEAGTLALRTMKNSDQDIAFVPPATMELLREHVGDQTSGPVFATESGTRLSTRSAHRRLAGWAVRAGIERTVSPHHLRHSLAMAVYGRTGDLLVTARALCHRSVASAAVYARPSEAAVRAAVAG